MARHIQAAETTIACSGGARAAHLVTQLDLLNVVILHLRTPPLHRRQPILKTLTLAHLRLLLDDGGVEEISHASTAAGGDGKLLSTPSSEHQQLHKY